MSLTFYKAFEEKYRGTRELIKSRLKIYLPFIYPFAEIYTDCLSVDLGCGRGEWLELMDEEGIKAQGIDIDDEMLEECQEKRFSVEKTEAVAYLKSLDDDSQSIVSAFHLVEHIPFDDLQVLVQEALRVLKPAGLLILETPNPENIMVGTEQFYLDPTHLRPLPPSLLAFLPEYYGFYRTKILRLQESPNVLNETIKLSNVIRGVSPDYAVIAQKKGSADILSLFNDNFDKDYGISLDLLMSRFDSDTEAKIHKVETNKKWLQDQYISSQKNIAQFNYKFGKLESEYQTAKEKIDELNQSNHHWYVTANQLDEDIKAVYASKSWRIILRLRQAMHFSFRLASQPVHLFTWLLNLPKQAVCKLLAFGMRISYDNPYLRSKALKFLNEYPQLKQKIQLLAMQNGLISGNPAETNAKNQITSLDDLPSIKIMHAMSKVYTDKTNMENIIYLKVGNE